MHMGVHSFWSDVAAETDTSPASEQTAMRVLQRLVAVAMARPAIWTSAVVVRAPLSMRKGGGMTSLHYKVLQLALMMPELFLVRWYSSTRSCNAEQHIPVCR